eukprot:15010838-Ditylum_brightwellii.AAC.1
MATTEMENITATFIYASILRNKEEPTFEVIRAIHMLLNQNATCIFCGVYGNTLGLLGLTITTAAYRTRAWNYEDRYVDIAVPKYVTKALIKLGHTAPKKPEHSPHRH